MQQLVSNLERIKAGQPVQFDEKKNWLKFLIESEGFLLEGMILKSKDDYVLEGQKAHIAINGGGAVALLAFIH